MSAPAPPSPSPSLSAHPVHLGPSELGTKDYWDNYYKTDLSNLDKPQEGSDDGEGDGASNDDEGGVQTIDPTELPSWFSDVSAPEKILSYLTEPDFPLAPSNWPSSDDSTIPLPSVLDLGTGNGSLLFQLRTEGEFEGNRMCGIDYSGPSIELSRRLGREIGGGCEDIEFETVDIIRDDWANAAWWPKQSSSNHQETSMEKAGSSSSLASGWDIVLDKGTFDAISLSAEEIEVVTDNDDDDHHHQQPSRTLKRICELYPPTITHMVKPGGFLLITSCNWTEDEVIQWFIPESPPPPPPPPPPSSTRMQTPKLEVYGKVKYSTYRFGGHEGQGVASICFRRVE